MSKIQIKMERYQRLRNMCKKLYDLENFKERDCHSDRQLFVTFKNDETVIEIELSPKDFIDTMHIATKMLEDHIAAEEAV